MITEYNPLFGLPTNFCLNLTNSCPLRCGYCFCDWNSKMMKIGTAIRAIERLILNIDEKRKILQDDSIVGHVQFFGGEPTANWETLVQITNYIKENHPKDIKLGITTNAVLLNKERIQFLKDNDIFPLLSIDGGIQTQNCNRPYANGKGSFYDVLRNIPDLLEAFPDMTFRSTLYEEDCSHIFENFLFAQSLGFKRMFLCPDSRHNFSKESLSKVADGVSKVFNYTIEKVKKREFVISSNIVEKGFYYSIMKESEKQIIMNPRRKVFRCGLGTTGISVSPTGEIYACQEQTTSGDINNKFYIGTLNTWIDEEKHLKLLQEYSQPHAIIPEERGRCATCAINSICNEVSCPSSVQTRFQDFFISPKLNCDWLNIITSNADFYKKNFKGSPEECLNYMAFLQEIMLRGED